MILQDRISELVHTEAFHVAHYTKGHTDLKDLDKFRLVVQLLSKDLAYTHERVKWPMLGFWNVDRASRKVIGHIPTTVEEFVVYMVAVASVTTFFETWDAFRVFYEQIASQYGITELDDFEVVTERFFEQVV